MIDTSEIKAVSLPDNLTGENLDILSETFYYLTSKRHMNIFDKSKVFEILKELQRFTKPLSFEFLKYLLYTEYSGSHDAAISLMGTSFLNYKTRANIRKVKKILKAKGISKITTSQTAFKVARNINGMLKFLRIPRTFHCFEIE